MNKILYTIGLALTFSLGVMAQQTVNGVVKDSSGKPVWAAYKKRSALTP